MELNKFLPQKPPFRFIDNIINFNKNHIRATFKFSEKLDFFKGHFPKKPIVPGVLIIEAIGQASTILALKKTKSKYAYLVMLKQTKISGKLYPNDEIYINSDIENENGNFITFRGIVNLKKNNKKIATTLLTLYVGD